MNADRFHDDQKWDVHWVGNPAKCRLIEKRIGKPLLAVKGPTDDGLLPYGCVFKGPQTTFDEGEKDEQR